MKKILHILAAAAMFFSCSDDFLDKKPLDKLSEEDVFNNDALAEAYVNSFYVAIPDPFTEGNIGCCSDEGFFRYGGTSTNYIARGQMTPDNVMYMSEGGAAHNTRMTFLNIWNRAYGQIRNMNDFLSRMETNTTLSEAIRKRLTGEVYFLRAWTYANLIERYGGVPIIKKAYGMNDEFGAKRDMFDDCVDFILEDLTEAKKYLSETSVLGRVNSDVCLALESRITLIAASPLFNDPANPAGSIVRGAYSADKWERARKAAKAIVDRADVDGAYSLASTYDDHWKNINSDEVIWAKYFTSTSGNKAQLFYALIDASETLNGWSSMEPTEALVLDYEMAATGKKIFEEGSGYDPQKPWDGRDPRFYKSISQPFGTVAGYKIDNAFYYKAGVTEADFAAGMKEPSYESKGKHMINESTTTGYVLRKWIIEDAAVTENENTTRMYPWFRLPEMYLNYAEAAYMCNDETTCRQYINKVRDRADLRMPHVTESGTALFDRLVNERRIELAFESFRYFDLRRWKLAPFYENIPMAGTRLLVLTPDASKPDEKQHLIRTVRVYDASKNDKVYYTQNRVYDYEWLGRKYRIDYGDCLLSFMAPQKSFPANGSHYLMPIGRNEITKSEKSIEQNPGYN